MRLAPLLALLLVASAGCVSNLPPAVNGATGGQEASPERSFLLSGAAAWRFNVTGPDNVIEMNLSAWPTPSAALLFVAESEEYWTRMMLYPGHPPLVEAPAREGFRVEIDSFEAGAGKLSLHYEEAWWNKTLTLFVAHADASGPADYQLTLAGTQIRTVGDMERGPAWYVPPDAWEGERYTLHQDSVIASGGRDLRASWNMTRGTVASYMSEGFWASPRYENLTLQSHNYSWHYNRVNIAPTPFAPRIGPQEGNGSISPSGFVLVSDEKEWSLSIRQRAALGGGHDDALILADLRPTFMDGTSLYSAIR